MYLRVEDQGLSASSLRLFLKNDRVEKRLVRTAPRVPTTLDPLSSDYAAVKERVLNVGYWHRPVETVDSH